MAEGTSSKSPSESMAVPSNPPLMYKDTMELNGKFQEKLKESNVNDNGDADVSIEIIGATEKVVSDEQNQQEMPVKKQYSFAKPSISTTQNSKKLSQPISASLSTQVIEGSISEKDLIDSQVLSKLSNGETMDMSINVEAEANETMMMNLNDITDPFEKTPDTSTPSHNRFNFIDDETPSGKSLKSLSDKNSNEHKTSNIFKVLAERENNGNYGQIENDSDMGIVLGEIEGDDDDEEEDSRVDDSYLPINLNVGTRKRVYDDSLDTDQINIYTDNNDNDNNNNNNNGLTQKDGNFNEEVNKALRKREEMEKAAEAAARGEHVNANDETTTGFWQGGSKADDTQLSHDEVGLGVTGAEGNNDKTYDNILGNISFSHQTPLTKLSDQVPADGSSSVFVQVPGTGEKDTKECDTSSESPLKLKANGSLLNNSRLLSITKSVRREIENIATSTNENNEDDNNNNKNNNNNEIDNDNDKVVVSDSSDDEEVTDNVDSLKKKDLINNKSVIEVVSSQGSVSGTQTQHIGTYQIGNLLDSLNISQSQMHSVKDQQQQLHKSQVNQIVGDTITVSESSPIITNENIVSQNGSDIASSTSMKGVISSKSNDLSVLNEENDNELSSNEDQDSDDGDDENGVHRAKRRKTTVISSYTSQPFTSGELKNNNSDNNKIAHDLSTKETQMIEGGGSVSQFSELGYQLSSKEASTYNYLGREDEMNDDVEMDDDNKASMGVPDTALIQDNSFNGSFTFDEIDEGQDDDEENGERSQKDNENDLIEIKDDESSKVLDEKSCKIDTSIWLSEGTLIYPSSIETIFFKEEDKIFGDILIPKKSRMNYYFDNEQKKMILDILNSLQIDKLDVKDFEIKLKDFESSNSNNSSSSTSTSSSSSSSTIHVPCQRIYAPLSIKVGDEVKYMKNKKHFYIITGLSYDSKNKNSLRCMRGYNTVSIKKRPPKRKRNIKQQKGDYDEVVIGDEDKDFQVGIDELYLTSPQGSSIGFKPFNDEFKFKRYLLEMYKRKFDKITNVTDAAADNGGVGGDDDDNDDDVLKDMNLTFAKCIFCTTNLKNESKVKKIIKKLGGRLIEDFKEIIKINYDSINNELELSNDTRDLTILKNYEFSAVISKEPIRTLKYLEGLALNWPILSEEFIIDCELDNFSGFTNWDTYVLPAGKSNFRNGCELSLNLTKFINNYKDSKKNKLYDQLCLNRDILQNYVIVVVVSKNKVEFLKFFFYLLGVFKIKFINDLESLERQGGLDFLQDEYNKSEEKNQDLNYCIYVPSFQSLGDFQNDKDGELELSIGSGLISKQMNQISKKLKWRVGKLNKIDKLYLISWEWLVQCMITKCSKVPLSYWDLSN